jgi:hypothetical protein
MQLNNLPLATTIESAHEFFVACGGVAGALIGLLFVAISVSPGRISGPDALESQRIRAASALTAFVNALVVSLFALIPDDSLGWAATVVAIVGLLSVTDALIGLVNVRRTQRPALRDATFLVGLVAIFGFQLVNGIRLIHHPNASGAIDTICILVVVCFLVGVARAWELVGGPTLGFHHLVQSGRAAIRRRA